MTKLAKKTLASNILNCLKESFPNAKCTLLFDDPYRFAIRGILSAQCKDSNVNEVTKELFSRYEDPEDLLGAPINDIESIICRLGLFRAKSQSIIDFTSRYLNDWGMEIPKSQEELMKVRGVGRKIANLILGEVYGIPLLVIDTHMIRVTRRMGLTKEKEQLKVEKDLALIIDSEEYINFGHLVIALGRSFCDAKKPLCETCPINDLCKKKL